VRTPDPAETEGGRERVLRRIFGPKRDGITGDWRELHNEDPSCRQSSAKKRGGGIYSQ
jgi:hypothetical protein